MCQQCVNLGIANPPNRKGSVAQVRREPKKPAEGEEGNNKRGRGKR